MHDPSQLSNFARFLHEVITTTSQQEVMFGEDGFNALALQLFRAQRLNNPVYRRYCDQLNCAPDSVVHWSAIPALPTLAFKEMDVTSLPLAQRTVVFHSSGTTTDRPSRHYHNNESLRLYETSAVHWFGAHFPIGPGEHAFRCLALTPPPSLVPQSSLVHMFKTIRQHGSIGQFDYTGTIDAEGGWTLDLEKTLCLLAASKATPLLLLGTAFSYVQLLDYLATRSDRVRLPPGSAALETGGYKGRSRSLPKNELHAFLAQQLGIPAQRIVSEYGMSELSSQAYDLRMATTTSKPDQETRQDTRVFHFPPWARARIVSVENGQEVGNGEVGLIRVIDLANVWSVLAIQTQDLALRRANGFEMLGRAPGAENRGCSLMSTAS